MPAIFSRILEIIGGHFSRIPETIARRFFQNSGNNCRPFFPEFWKELQAIFSRILEIITSHFSRILEIIAVHFSRILRIIAGNCFRKFGPHCFWLFLGASFVTKKCQFVRGGSCKKLECLGFGNNCHHFSSMIVEIIASHFVQNFGQN